MTTGVDSEHDPRLLPSRDSSTNYNDVPQPCSCVVKSFCCTGAGLGMKHGIDSEQDPRLLCSREFLTELVYLGCCSCCLHC